MNGNEPAFPMILAGEKVNGQAVTTVIAGLTKREYAAIHIAAIMGSDPVTKRSDVPEKAVRLADAVLIELAKGEDQ